MTLAYVLSKNVERRHMNPVQILKVLEVARPALEAEAVARKRAALRQGAPPTADAVGRNSAQRGRVSEQIAQWPWFRIGISLVRAKGQMTNLNWLVI